jgi:hypothetical protein
MIVEYQMLLPVEDPVKDLWQVPEYLTGEFRHASAAIEVS